VSVLIDGNEHKWLPDAAREAGIAYMTLYMHVLRHPDFHRVRLGKLIFVRLEDVLQYKRNRH
jgi:hypothetical protein